MSKLKEEIMAEFDEYVKKSNINEERKLNRQRNKAIKECRRVHKMLKKKGLTFKEEVKTIEKKMIPYIGRMKWLPKSYKDMLSEWEDRYLGLGGRQ